MTIANVKKQFLYTSNNFYQKNKTGMSKIEKKEESKKKRFVLSDCYLIPLLYVG